MSDLRFPTNSEITKRLLADAAMPVSTKTELLTELAREEERLAELDRQREAARSRVKSLREELAVLPAHQSYPSALPVITNAQAPTTSTEKIHLFRSLFKGRKDIFPTRFESKKTGKPGYAPACANKFVRGVCELPKVKCGECTNQAGGRFGQRV